MLKWQIDDVPLFVAVIDHNSMTAAARVLGVPKSTISAAIARLERGLGLRLIERNSRNLRITPDGEAFYRQAQLILDQVHEADALAAGLSADPAGRLAVAVPPAFAQEILAPNLVAFQVRYPGIELDIAVTSHGLELLRDQIDLAVVVGPLEDSELISRTLLSGPLTIVASPDYLARHRIGQTLAEIGAHFRICEKRYARARMPVHVNGQSSYIDLSRTPARVNDPLVVRRAVLGGAGISILPRHYCLAPLANGALQEVCRHVTFDLSASALLAVFPHRRLISPRQRVFLDFLAEICASYAGLLAASNAATAQPNPISRR